MVVATGALFRRDAPPRFPSEVQERVSPPLIVVLGPGERLETKPCVKGPSSIILLVHFGLEPIATPHRMPDKPPAYAFAMMCRVDEQGVEMAACQRHESGRMIALIHRHPKDKLRQEIGDLQPYFHAILGRQEVMGRVDRAAPDVEDDLPFRRT